MPLRSIRRYLCLALAAACAFGAGGATAPAAPAPAPESGKPLKVGVNGGVGLLASPNAYLTVPLGAAHVTGGDRPDLFVNASRGIETALYLYAYERDDAEGLPIFAPPITVRHPFGEKSTPGEGAIFDDAAGGVHGFWIRGNELTRCRYDREARAFVRVAATRIEGLPRSPTSLAVTHLSADRVELVLACADQSGGRPEGDRSRDDYVLYDGTGRYTGVIASSGLYRVVLSADLSKVITPVELCSRTASEVRANLNTVAYDVDGDVRDGHEGVLAGTRFGNLFYFPFEDGRATLGERRPVFGPEGHSIRHPTVGMTPIVYRSRGDATPHLIAGGEGALYFYRYDGHESDGRPRYSNALPVWQEDADVYAGSLAIPTAADWDGDGAQDLIVGNSQGQMLFFRNHGSNLEPKFGIGEPLEAGGEPIHIQPGYYGIQGPFEARWGYTSAAVTDWSGDGLPDLLLSSSTAEHLVYLNEGTRTQPRLARGRPLYWDGLELHGMWRVRPAAARIDGRMAYVFQDDDNALRLMWRVDDYNLADGGPLRLTDGGAITTHIENVTGPVTGPGQKGRSKLEWVDWDGDGLLDLLIGTAKRGAVPNPADGLPWARQKDKVRSLQVLLLRNAGTNAEPAFEFPRQFRFRGKDIYLGAHENGPAACELGDASDGPNLLIGMESGRIYFYQRQDLTFYEGQNDEAATATAFDASQR